MLFVLTDHVLTVDWVEICRITLRLPEIWVIMATTILVHLIHCILFVTHGTVLIPSASTISQRHRGTPTCSSLKLTRLFLFQRWLLFFLYPIVSPLTHAGVTNDCIASGIFNPSFPATMIGCRG